MKGQKLAERLQDALDAHLAKTTAQEAGAFDAGLEAALALVPPDRQDLYAVVMELESLATSWQIAAGEAGMGFGLALARERANVAHLGRAHQRGAVM